MTTQENAKFTQSLFSELPTDFDFDGTIEDLADRLHDWVNDWTTDGEYFGVLTPDSLDYMHGKFDYIALARFLASN